MDDFVGSDVEGDLISRVCELVNDARDISSRSGTMAVASAGFRWLDALEKEFDKSLVDLDLILGETRHPNIFSACIHVLG